jgi:hypothetical protein
VRAFAGDEPVEHGADERRGRERARSPHGRHAQGLAHARGRDGELRGAGKRSSARRRDRRDLLEVERERRRPAELGREARRELHVRELVDDDIRGHRREVDGRAALEHRGRERRERGRAGVLGERAVRPHAPRLERELGRHLAEVERAPAELVDARPPPPQARLARPAELEQLHSGSQGLLAARDATLPHAGRPLGITRGCATGSTGAASAAACMGPTGAAPLGDAGGAGASARTTSALAFVGGGGDPHAAALATNATSGRARMRRTFV